jgi:(1->4)-alpha-D-glucan 1-alpha-D-glucosylmutase
MIAQAKRWPLSMSTLSTHDTKRSADVRARLNVLSEVPGAWRDATQQWADNNDRHRNGVWPDRNAEYLLYQTLVGAWPIDTERVVAFMRKATHEAKVHTSWLHPVAAYDDEVESYIRRVLGDETFLLALQRFLDDQRIVERGFRNSLSQTALLLTCPGVPDLYQGTELWDLSLVDPDNRRPVDYERRRALLAQLHDSPATVIDDWAAGGPKLALVHRVLQYRAQHRALAETDRYEPLTTEGPRAAEVVAFLRDDLAVCAPCRTREGWGDTTLTLPVGEWVHLVTGDRHRGGRLSLGELLRSYPVALLAREGR